MGKEKTFLAPVCGCEISHTVRILTGFCGLGRNFWVFEMVLPKAAVCLDLAYTLCGFCVEYGPPEGA